jgi:hypothetical protein
MPPVDSLIGDDAMRSPGLVKSEADRFLEFLFGDIALRPKPLRPLETAAVVRYLLSVAWMGVPTEVIAQGDSAIHAYWQTERRWPDAALRQNTEQLALGGFGGIS